MAVPIVLFDGICNYCNRLVNFAIRHDPKALLKYIPLQSELAAELKTRLGVPVGIDSLILIEGNRFYTHSGAAFRAARYLQGPAKLLYAFYFIPRFLRDPVYKWIARRRYKWFGKRDACMVPSPGVKKRFPSSLQEIEDGPRRTC